ncbi:MAG: DUF2835 family protein [Gammaproteobacteria bacterium]|nr:MAG: DUF2835 family protein [Gammaproteobacteria bacterium]
MILRSICQNKRPSRFIGGQAKYLLVVTDDGLKLQFPIGNFRAFVSEQGIQGRFRAETDERHRLLKLEKL